MNYWDSTKTIPQIIFNPQLNDWGSYQARELSYFFDYIDAQFIRISIAAGIIHFYSLVSFMFVLCCIFVQQIALRDILPESISGYNLSLFSLLFVLTPVFEKMIFFRSSKPGVALGITIVLYLTIKIMNRAKKQIPWNMIVLLTCASVFTGLLDRQGVFFVASYASIICLAILFRKCFVKNSNACNHNTRLFIIALAAQFSTLFLAIYNILIAPLLIYTFNSTLPDFSYQNINCQNILTLPMISRCLYFFCANIGCELTSIDIQAEGVYYIAYAVGAFAMISLFIGLAYRFWATRNEKILMLLFYYVFGASATFVCCLGMLTRHPQIIWHDVIFSGYFTPSYALFVMFLLSVVNALASLERLPKCFFSVVTVLIVIKAIFIFPFWQKEILPSHLDGVKAETKVFLKLWDSPLIANAQISPNLIKLSICFQKIRNRNNPTSSSKPGS